MKNREYLATEQKCICGITTGFLDKLGKFSLVLQSQYIKKFRIKVEKYYDFDEFQRVVIQYYGEYNMLLTGESREDGHNMFSFFVLPETTEEQITAFLLNSISL